MVTTPTDNNVSYAREFGIVEKPQTGNVSSAGLAAAAARRATNRQASQVSTSL